MAFERSPDHPRFHYSIHCKTDDPMVLACLRALCHVSEEHSKPSSAWGGTGEADWRAADQTVTFRFTKPEYRDRFAREANRLLPNRWSEIDRSDNNPAIRQRVAVVQR